MNPIADIGDIRGLVPTCSLAPQFAGPRIEPPSPQKFLQTPPCAGDRVFDIIGAFTVKALTRTSMKTKETHERIAEIIAKMASITEFAEGSISSSSNSYTVKDGTRRKAKPHWKFQSLGQRGKRKYKSIPAAVLPKVKKLIENGRRYRRLEAEYSRLVTEASLDSLKKTAGEG